MEQLISIQAAADRYSISTRWIWKLIRVDKVLIPHIRNERIYIKEIDWERFVNKNPKVIEKWSKLHRHLMARYIGQNA